ncbi:MAG: type II/IV secretion system protein [Sedimentisphaerales bacterium]|nr:type II/IV secretion system protein [Sedimentisphaerales bacterium]
MIVSVDSVFWISHLAQTAPFTGPNALDPSGLSFSPVKLLVLIGWIYLCLYCVQRVEYSPLVSERYKPLVSVFSLVVGPFIFFVLAVADVTTKLQEGDIHFDDILSYFFGNAFVGRKKLGARKAKDEDFIELLDSSGRNFFVEAGGKDLENLTDQKTLEFTHRILREGIRQRASDILIDPKSSGIYTVRYRVDGYLRLVEEVESDRARAMVNSIKAIAGMDIAERRRALDGAFMARIAAGDVYFRVASAGVLGGEKLSLRVLNQAQGMLTLDQIGLSEEGYRLVREAIDQPQGMVLVCGPTGSGKTTTLYGMLGEVDFYTRNVVTVEDPIEYVLPHASQMEVNPKANITFGNSMRSILRQDPDIIVVGEIRDGETAQMVVQASHTGHLVLATLHSSSNLATLARLIDLGVKPLMLASALNVIISQRLVRRLCDHCKQPAQLDTEQIAGLERLGLATDGVMQSGGCKNCNYTGFLGRVAIVDVLHVDDPLKASLTGEGVSLAQLKQDGDNRGRSHLRREGLAKVAAGITTIEEVKRVTTHLG